MKKKYKIQLPKGKKVIVTKMNMKDGEMSIDVEIREKDALDLLVEDMVKKGLIDNRASQYTSEQIGKVFTTLNIIEDAKKIKDYLMSHPLNLDRLKVRIATEKLEQAAKEYINEHDEQIDKILKMADDKDVRAVANMISQEYGENICRKKQPKCPRTLSKPKIIDEIDESIKKHSPKRIEDIEYIPDDGDIVHILYGDTHEEIAIFYYRLQYDVSLPYYIVVGKEEDLLGHGYAYYMLSKEEAGYKDIDEALRICKIMPATKKEKDMMLNHLASIGKRWNPETKTIEDVRWRAKVGETFYYVDTFGMIMSMERFDHLANRHKKSSKLLELSKMESAEDILWKKGNYFKTEEAAEKVAKQIRDIFKSSKAE